MCYTIIVGEYEKKSIIISVIIIIIIPLLLINKKIVDDYNFTLKGNNAILLNIGDIWTDPLYNNPNDKEVEIEDNINLQKEGIYQKKYSIRVGLFKKNINKIYLYFK